MRENAKRTLWYAIFFTTLVYAALAFIVAHRHSTPAMSLASPNDIAVIVVAALLFTISFGVGPVLKVRDVARGYFVTLALLETVCLVGLVGAFRTGDWRVFVAPWCLSMIGMIYAYPRASEPF